jgi:hypothetical protein
MYRTLRKSLLSPQKHIVILGRSKPQLVHFAFPVENRYLGILPGESYIDIHALVDFLFVFKIPNREKRIILRRSPLKKIRFFMISAIACGNFARNAMTNLERSQKILVGSLENLIHFLLGHAANMKICQLLSRLVQI